MNITPNLNCDNLPKHLSIHRHVRLKYHCERIDCKGKHWWKAYCIGISFNRIFRFIHSYVGKPYNDCYSDWLKKIKQDRRTRKGSKYYQEEIYYFKICFEIGRYTNRIRFGISTDGLITKTIIKSDHPKNAIRMIKLIEPTEKLERLFRSFKLSDLYQKLLIGMPYNEFNLENCYVFALNRVYPNFYWYNYKRSPCFKSYWEPDGLTEKQRAKLYSEKRKRENLKRKRAYRDIKLAMDKLSRELFSENNKQRKHNDQTSIETGDVL